MRRYLTPVGLSALGPDLIISSLNLIQSDKDTLHADLLCVAVCQRKWKRIQSF